MQLDQIPRAICHSLLLSMREGGIEDIPANDAKIDTAVASFLKFVEGQCRQASEAGNDGFVDECLYLLDKLGADAATGRHDLFWAQLRELQPGSLSFGNPTYKIASLPDHFTNDPAYKLSNEWKEIIDSTVPIFVSALQR